MTVHDLISAALTDLGALQAGEVPSPEDAAVALDRLNDWIDTLATERLSVYTLTRTTWPLTGAATITVGPGGDINIARPVSPSWIEHIGYVDTSVTPNDETLIGPVLTEDQYAERPQKAQTGVYPSAFYYTPTFPLGTLKPLPVPTGTGLLGVIYVPTAVPEYTALSTTVALPPGYRRFLRSNLALELAPAFDAQVSETLHDRARDSKSAVKRVNRRQMDLATGFGAGGYDIYTDTGG